MNNSNELSSTDVTSLKRIFNFTIAPYDMSSMIPAQYSELALSKNQQSHLSLLQSQIPDTIENAIVANAYVLKFPDGLPHTLMKLKQGGVSTTFINADKKIAGTASLYNLKQLSVICSCFSFFSFATGQYYLDNLHNDLKLINQKIDKILGFLYGEKSAELLSEITFVNDAYKNYNNIVQNDCHKLATITNLQSSKKIAIKDIEFYINDLSKTVSTPTKNYQEFEKIVDDSLKIKDSLTLAIQLYTMSNILEVYYSENFDAQYVDYVKSTISNYISKCNNRILTEFGRLNGRNSEFKSGPLKKIDISILEKALSDVINDYSVSKELNVDRHSVVDALDSINAPKEYIVTKDGRVFFQNN